MILPFSSKRIRSAVFTVCNLCATTMTVFPLKRLCSAIFISSSLKLSSADVGSSRRMIFGFLSIIFAIANLCFCPPLNLTPLSPISVSNPCSNSRINSHLASLTTFSIISGSGSLSSAYVRFS